MRLCLLGTSEVISIKPHQHDCLYIEGTQTTAVDMQTWRSRAHGTSSLPIELQATREFQDLEMNV